MALYCERRKLASGKSTTMMVLLAIVLLASVARANAATIEFSTIPTDGSVSGPPGTIVGWGYSLVNNSTTDWFMPVLLNADSFSFGSSSVLFDFPLLAPQSSVVANHNSSSGLGLYELLWDSGVPVGFVNSGSFVLSGQWWDGDPFGGGSFLYGEPDISVPYSASVGDGTSIVPEPASWGLITIGVAACLLLRRRRRKC